MPWPETLQEQFDIVTTFGEVDETEYYGPYNSLLSELFPGSEHFMIALKKRPTHPQYSDFYTLFIAQRRKHPVFLIQIRPSGHINNASDRASADEQMRQWFDALYDKLSIPTLYGVSALGTKLCFYLYDSQTGTLTPPAIERDPIVANDRAPADRWNLDVMESDGEQRMKEIVALVKKMCEEL